MAHDAIEGVGLPSRRDELERLRIRDLALDVALESDLFPDQLVRAECGFGAPARQASEDDGSERPDHFDRGRER